MRVAEGAPAGRFAKLYNPKMFQEHEEVIVFTRDDINRIYTSIREEIDDINKIDLHLDRSEEWKLISYWPKIMQNISHIDVNLNLIFKKEPLQSYLDAYLYDNVRSSQKDVAVSKKKSTAKIKASNQNLLY